MKTGNHEFTNRKIFQLISFLLPLVLALSACQPAANQAPPAAATTAPVMEATATAQLPETGSTAAPTTTSAEAAINVTNDPNLGKILVDGNGMTLYMYTKDEANKSNCSGKCLENWPALTTQGKPVLGDGVDPALVGTAAMPDGSLIVTYNKMPLYTFIKDKQAGDVTGQDSNHVWYVVAPDGNPVGYTMPAAAEPLPAADEATINVATDAKLGQILVDGKGMTLYMYTKDEANKSNCSGKCLEFWPPLKTQGKPVLGEGVDPALIGTATLPDGSLIVTYNKMPLYYFAKDKQAGDVTGQDSNHVWYVVAPDGNPVGYTMPGAADTTPVATEKPDY